MGVNLPANFVSAVEKAIKDLRDLKGLLVAVTPRRGTAILVAGQATVTLASVTANTHIQLTIQTPGGAVGAVYVNSRTAGTSFVIKSTSATDTSTVAWAAVEPQ